MHFTKHNFFKSIGDTKITNRSKSTVVFNHCSSTSKFIVKIPCGTVIYEYDTFRSIKAIHNSYYVTDASKLKV